VSGGDGGNSVSGPDADHACAAAVAVAPGGQAGPVRAESVPAPTRPRTRTPPAIATLALFLKDMMASAALTSNWGSRGKIQDWCCHGLIASADSRRRTVLAEIASARHG